MRWALAILALAACDGMKGTPCHVDSMCGGDVCSNTEVCESSDNLQQVKVQWTVNGAPASSANCAPSPTLTIMVVDHTYGTDDYGLATAWGPVACTEGGYAFNRLPVDYDIVELMADSAGGGGEGDVPSGGGDVAIDMGYPVP